MKDNIQYYCPKCKGELSFGDHKTVCGSCNTAFDVKDGIPLFAEDRYWGKVKEQELITIIQDIKTQSFFSFTKEKQKKLDFTFDEDRADWRFYIPLTAESTVLDVGAGLGRISIPLARVAKNVVSCDLSHSRMHFLQERARAEDLLNIDVCVADIFHLPFKENTFDVIVLNGVLEWVGLSTEFVNPRDAQLACLRICKKLLKKGGCVYVGIENRAAIAYIKAKDHGGLRYTSYMPRLLANFYSKLRGKGEYRTYTYTKHGYEQLIRESGFTKVPEFYLPYPGYNLPRIIIPYEPIKGLSFIINNFKPRHGVWKILLTLTQIPIVMRIYRYFFYSFGIVIYHD